MIGWVLGTFHTVAFGVVALLLIYPRGGLGATLANLNTLTGLALFLALWATTVVTTARAFAGLDPLAGDTPTGLLYRRALRWGAVNGVLFLWSQATLLALTQLVTVPGSLGLPSLGLGALFVVGIGSPFALVIGAVLGVVLGALDLAALAIARALVRA